MTATATRKRARRDGDVQIYGVTPGERVIWRIGSGRLHETKASALRAARGRIRNTPDGLVLLGCLEVVNESDLDLLLAAHAETRSGKRSYVCPVCHYDTTPGQACMQCLDDDMRWDV